MKRAGLCLLILASVSCGELTRQGTASSFLVINALEASSGAEAQFGGDLNSDVVTVVDDVPTIFSDSGQVTFTLTMKDPGITAPSSANAITVNRYRVRFIRSDGRNTEGVDVPHAFDGAFTVTVSTTASAAFTLVRAQAKAEAPLAALATSPVVISTIAEVTFFGHDQTGREVITIGRIGVHFANWGDPE